MITQWRRGLRLLGRICVALVALHLVLTALAVGLNRIPRTQQTAVICTGIVHWDDHVLVSARFATPLLKAFLYAPVTLRQNLLGRNAAWWNNVPWRLASAVVSDPRYQSVVFVGHGASGVIALANGAYVSSYYRAEKKSGELIQLSCGGGEETPFSRVMLRDPTRSFEFSRPVDFPRVCAAAWYLAARALVTSRL